MSIATATIPAQAIVPVLVVDLDQLTCIEASASNFERDRCKLLSDRVGELHEYIGLRLNGVEKMIKGRITSVSDGEADVWFEFKDAAPREKRRERRRQVSIPTVAVDAATMREWACTIVDASKSGCRLKTEYVKDLPTDITLQISGIDMPVRAEIVWRSADHAGVRMLWQFSSSREVNVSKVRPPSLAQKAAPKNRAAEFARSSGRIIGHTRR
ncbi:MAG: PilZ domain-containing protein [Roseibium sp.]|nr:PilZ domain-containing protein [Roseibium sp.]